MTNLYRARSCNRELMQANRHRTKRTLRTFLRRHIRLDYSVVIHGVRR